ncbi:MAG: hypothetical protein ACH350_07565 [Parachlamydiaceae bacterium]
MLSTNEFLGVNLLDLTVKESVYVVNINILFEFPFSLPLHQLSEETTHRIKDVEQVIRKRRGGN